MISLGNLRGIRTIGTYMLAKEAPSVTILVPARNEEKNIEKCVLSLLQQAYPVFDIIVLDDNSTDATGEILARIVQRHAKLAVMQGTPKPSEWSGKHWACHQLARAAKGELLMFTDADTVHDPNTLQDAVNMLIAEQADLITAMPREEVVTLAEKLVVPVMHWATSTFLPAGIAHRTRYPGLCLANGQFMLYRKEAYEAVGGHEAIKSEILDDVPLAKRIKAANYRWRIADGSRRITCRMYNGFKEVYNGFTRNLFSAFGYNTPFFVFAWTWLLIVYLQPVVTLVFHYFMPFLSPVVAWDYAGCIGLALLSWVIPLIRFKFPWYIAFFYPAIIVLVYVISIRSMVHTKRGKISWKGRDIEKDARAG